MGFITNGSPDSAFDEIEFIPEKCVIEPVKERIRHYGPASSRYREAYFGTISAPWHPVEPSGESDKGPSIWKF